MKLFKRKRNSKIIELIERRDEVTRRAVMIANRNIPQWLMDEPLPKVIEWIIAPHLYKNWEKYVKIDLKEIRHDQKLTYKILGAYAKNKEKNKKNKGEDNDNQERIVGKD